MLTKGFRWFNKTHPKPNLLLSVNPFFYHPIFFSRTQMEHFLWSTQMCFLHIITFQFHLFFSPPDLIVPSSVSALGHSRFCVHMWERILFSVFFSIRCYGICVKMKSYYNIILFKQLYSQIFASAWSLNFHFSETSKYLIATVGSVLYLDEKKIEWAHQK